jgi:hypothetical protein
MNLSTSEVRGRHTAIRAAISRLIDSKPNQLIKRKALFASHSQQSDKAWWQIAICNFWVKHGILHRVGSTRSPSYSLNQTDDNLEYLMSLNSAKQLDELLRDALGNERNTYKKDSVKDDEELDELPPETEEAEETPEPQESISAESGQALASLLKLTYGSSEAIIDIRDRILKTIFEYVVSMDARLARLEAALLKEEGKKPANGKNPDAHTEF